MLTSLDFLRRGSSWPPDSERERLREYRDYKAIYNDDHAEIYKQQFARIERIIGHFDRVISVATILNYQRLLTTKLVDLVLGEPPTITCPEDAQQEAIDRVMLESDFIRTMWLAAIDVSRYGDAVVLLQDDGGRPALSVLPPALWFPVVDPTDCKRIIHHVFGTVRRDGRESKLRVQIYTPDDPTTAEVHDYLLSGQGEPWTIASELPVEGVRANGKVETGVDTLPIYRIINTETSDNLFGISDYRAIDSIVAELIVRVSQISKILDVHASPSMSGPESALERDMLTGQYRLRAGNYFPRASDEEPRMEYITWDANLDANFKQIDTLMQALYTISEMGSAVFGDLKAGQIPSGSALKRLMISPLSRARRFATAMGTEMRRILSDMARMIGVEIPPDAISIRWNDGLPNDDSEMAQIMQIRTGGAPTISQHTAIIRLDGLTEDDAAAELEEIRADAVAADLSEPPVDYGGDDV